jgi:DNA (cytosine-5)-methyltransferase 1
MTPRSDFNTSQMELRLAPDEIIVDSFAGGGGASLGIQWALGRGPHIAINHDKEAIALHAANHPDSEHYPEDVWHVDPVEACAGRKVGLMWLSPDCKHFSKAKGGKPVSKKIRGLAWTAVRWATAVRPRVIVLENVEEFQTWGPVDRATNRPCPERKGHTFKRFVARLRRLGYQVEWRELRACDYGAPTIRKRLFLIARCDGRSITWPAPTHGKGRAQPWRTAAECIEWSIPCPSIFERKKALADNTMRRIARGVQRYVIDSPTPFIVQYHSAKRPGDDRIAMLDAPLGTQTVENRFGIVTPHITKFHSGSTGSELTEPMPTVTSNSFEKRPGGAVPLGLVAPTLIQTGYGERPGQAPRSLDIEAPLGTIVSGGKHALAAAFLAKHQSERHEGEVQASSLDEATPTVKTRDSTAVVAAHVAKHYGGRVGSSADEPLHTVTAESVHHSLVSSTLLNLHGTSNSHLTARSVEEPLTTVAASGMHAAEVRAFLISYYGTAQASGDLASPAPTVTAKDRLGLVTISGIEYQIVDIGMRMLQPRELYRAQGFPDSYKIAIPFDYEVKSKKTGKTKILRKPLTKTAQVRMAGNSVCPPLAAAIVSANLLGETFAANRRGCVA